MFIDQDVFSISVMQLCGLCTIFYDHMNVFNKINVENQIGPVSLTLESASRPLRDFSRVLIKILMVRARPDKGVLSAIFPYVIAAPYGQSPIFFGLFSRVICNFAE